MGRHHCDHWYVMLVGTQKADHAQDPAWKADIRILALPAVNFPIMGRIAKQSFERALSTVVGGWLGYAAYIVSQHPSVEIWAQCWTAVISVLFAFAALLMGVKLKLDYSAKLLGVTFVLGKSQTEWHCFHPLTSELSSDLAGYQVFPARQTCHLALPSSACRVHVIAISYPSMLLDARLLEVGCHSSPAHQHVRWTFHDVTL